MGKRAGATLITCLRDDTLSSSISFLARTNIVVNGHLRCRTRSDTRESSTTEQSLIYVLSLLNLTIIPGQCHLLYVFLAFALINVCRQHHSLTAKNETPLIVTFSLLWSRFENLALFKCCDTPVRLLKEGLYQSTVELRGISADRHLGSASGRHSSYSFLLRRQTLLFSIILW